MWQLEERCDVTQDSLKVYSMNRDKAASRVFVKYFLAHENGKAEVKKWPGFRERDPSLRPPILWIHFYSWDTNFHWFHVWQLSMNLIIQGRIITKIQFYCETCERNEYCKVFCLVRMYMYVLFPCDTVWWNTVHLQEWLCCNLLRQ